MTVICKRNILGIFFWYGIKSSVVEKLIDFMQLPDGGGEAKKCQITQIAKKDVQF